MKYVFFIFPLMVLGFAIVRLLKAHGYALALGQLVGAMQATIIMVGVAIMMLWSKK